MENCNPFKYTCLFGGGAIRGLAYIGTIRALEELGIEYDIIGGSSVGAVIAALLACGYKSYELENIFMKVNFDLFKDIHFGFKGALSLSKGGIFQDWLNELLTNKIQVEKGQKPAFKDLEQELVIITTDLTKFSSQEFSTKATPDFEIAQAIKISSSMPGLMPPYPYKDSLLVDGDLQKASPMWRLANTLNNSKSRILEFRLEGDFNREGKTPISFINTIYSCVTDIATKFVTDIYGQNDRYDYININTGDIFFADFNLNKEARRNLINIGYNRTMEYFKKYLPDKKEKLQSIYTKLYTYLRNSQKGLKMHNVEEVQWWLGDIFTLMCENKEIIDPEIYNQMVELKNLVMDSVKTILFFRTAFKSPKEINNKMNTTLQTLNCRIAESKLYLQKIK